jgi:MFS family permease
MITLATYGIGMLIGFYIAGLISDSYNSPAGHDWKMIWLIPAGIAAVVFLMFIVFFKDAKTVAAIEERGTGEVEV